MEITDQTLCFSPLLSGWSKHNWVLNFCLSSFSGTGMRVSFGYIHCFKVYPQSVCAPVSQCPASSGTYHQWWFMQNTNYSYPRNKGETFQDIIFFHGISTCLYDTDIYRDLTLLRCRIRWFRKTTMQNIKTGQIFTGCFTILGKAFKTQTDNMQHMHY